MQGLPRQIEQKRQHGWPSRRPPTSILRAAGIVSFVTIPLAGYLSDRIGRKRMYIIGAVATGIFGFIYFAMLNSTVPTLIFLGIVLSFVPHDLMYGPQAALIAECFTPRLRCSGASIGYQLSSIISGGPCPVDRYGTARGVRIWLCDCRVYPLLRGRQHRFDRDTTLTATFPRSTLDRPQFSDRRNVAAYMDTVIKVGDFA